MSESPASPAGRDGAERTAERRAPKEDDVVLRIFADTARASGEALFRALARALATSTHSTYALVAEVVPTRNRVRTLAVWGNGRFLDNVEYDLDGTPCEDVVRGNLCHHGRGVRERFPKDRMLVDMAVESYQGVPLLDDAGQVIGHLAVLDTRPMDAQPQLVPVFRILAARAAAELERLRMAEGHAESERRWRSLFEEAPIGYVYEDTQTRFVSANRAAQQLLGLQPEEVPHTVGLTLVAPTQDVRERVHDSLKSEQAGKEKPFIEIELRRKDNGKPVWIQRYSRPEPDGKHTRTMLVDITERVLAERERNRLRQQNAYLRDEIKAAHNFDEIIGASTGLRQTLTRVKQVAATDSTVLILGETGVGKELVARALHSNSRRKDRPLIKLNCAALPTGLIESELFGHEKGAFTGALERRVGRFALADGGTIFLDEIGDMPADVQVRLLRVLQEQEFEPVGSTKTMRVDVRVIAATNRDLVRAVADGEFRADLYYRLNVFPIAMPPLRERRSDIALLAHYFAERYAAKIGKRLSGIGDATIERLRAYAWPGNVRELENVIERAVILANDPILEIDGETLPTLNKPASQATPSTAVSDSVAANERAHILSVLEKANWRIEGERGAASRLGLHPNTLRSRMKRLGIARPHDGA